MAYEINEAKELVIKAGKELLDKGLIVRTWGNISARISDTQFVITPSGKAYENLTLDDIVVVNIDDLTYEGDIKPSSELAIHGDAYKMRPDVNFIVHTHQKYATCLSITGRNIEGIEAVAPNLYPVLGPVVPCASYGMNATPELRAAVAMVIKLYPSSKAFLMKNHGAHCLGADYDDAFKVAQALEEVSQTLYKVLCGKEVQGMGDMTFSQKYSFYGKSLLPYIDDFAMIAGTEIPCLNYRDLQGNSLEEMHQLNDLDKYMEDRDINCVIVKDRGIIYKTVADDELEAIRIVTEKNCMAAVLAIAVPGIAPVDSQCAAEEHEFYISSYSKMK